MLSKIQALSNYALFLLHNANAVPRAKAHRLARRNQHIVMQQ
jgi:hypothetical protein